MPTFSVIKQFDIFKHIPSEIFYLKITSSIDSFLFQGNGTYDAYVTVKWNVPYEKKNGSEGVTHKFELKFPERDEREGVGKCPICKGKVFGNSKSYYCENSFGENKTCNFPAIWRDNQFFKNKEITLTDSDIKKLLDKGKVLKKNIKKKDGSGTYEAYLVAEWAKDYEKSDGTIVKVNKYSLEFPDD